MESPAKGESQSNGAVEEAGKTVREFARLFKDVVETNMHRRVIAFCTGPTVETCSQMDNYG